ncbi:hypothetical protein Ade02nite_30580 [Paractinoplanes deccanensis]|uniref:DUF3311 domain-containing protein n=2 Tax=Paractinoplanes deccanensis TaxID=113561 RepID=A0ABQ3Y354_9ACTN|nr:hypothetical protein Ade02nite_30580 [Actinoplanes deccanensis]
MADIEAPGNRTRAGVRRWIGWLLAVPIIVPLVTPLFNVSTPRLWGFPAFYWLQIAFIVVGSAVTIVVYRTAVVREGE